MKKRWTENRYAALALMLAVSTTFGGTVSLLPMTTMAEEGDDLLIEDDGEVSVSREGERLEDVKAAEAQEAADAQAEADALAAAEAERQQLLEDMDIQPEPSSADQLEAHLTQLLSEENPTGSDGEMNIAAYIESVMESYGYTVTEHNFHEGFINQNGIDAPGINIIAERGADSENRVNDILIISTHYDSKTKFVEDSTGMSQALAGNNVTEAQENESEASDSSSMENKSEASDSSSMEAESESGETENGDLTTTAEFENDKSGAAVLLELARILSYQETDTDICFLFYSGEEDGGYGSQRFVESLDDEFKGRIIGNLNIDLVGYEPEYPYVLKTTDGSETYLGNLIKAEALRQSVIALNAVSVEGTTEAAGGMTAEEGAESDAGVLTDDDVKSVADAETGLTADTVKAWDYLADQEDSHTSFANIGISAVTVSQYAQGAAAQDTEMSSQSVESTSSDLVPVQGNSAPISIKKLQDITDILAVAIEQIMSERTGSFLL